MKKVIPFLLLFLLISLVSVSTGKPLVLAQNETEPAGFKNVRLWLYPEYDDPRLLVMMEGKIVGAEPPAKVKFLVPSGAEMYSAGSMDAQGRYSGGPPARKPSSVPGWDEISYLVTSDTFRVEYYDSVIAELPEKSIAYEFLRLYPISDLEVIVQEPRRSSNFTVSPAGRAFVDSENFNSYSISFKDLDTEKPVKFDIAYTRADTNPSVAPIKTFPETPSGRNPLLIPGILILAGIAIISVFLLVRKSRPQTRAERRQQSRATPSRVPSGPQPKARFCSQCGNPQEGSNKFCPNCGAKIP
ncbi:MAG: hypothetical protein U1D67_05740 [Dehalococcoidia bacterium]|nr:hypothetical protein [Dehalococcoidia bacterium]